jgi:hypothetical protein
VPQTRSRQRAAGRPSPQVRRLKPLLPAPALLPPPAGPGVFTPEQYAALHRLVYHHVQLLIEVQSEAAR